MISESSASHETHTGGDIGLEDWPTPLSYQNGGGDDSTPLARELEEETRRHAAISGLVLPVPRETRILTVSNQKGGVGKTTTAVNLAAALARGGLNVLVIDNDPQGNASTALGIDHPPETVGTYDVILGDDTLATAVQVSPEHENLQVVPATIDLAGAEIELVQLEDREYRLTRAVEEYRRYRQEHGQSRLDYILIDCPPSLGLLTVNALTTATEVLIPIQTEYYALEGLSQLVQNISLVQEHLNPRLSISTIILTMVDKRTNLSKEVTDEVREHFPAQVLDTTIPRSVRISEAPSYGQTVLTYDSRSIGSIAFHEIAKELAERDQKDGEQRG